MKKNRCFYLKRIGFVVLLLSLTVAVSANAKSVFHNLKSGAVIYTAKSKRRLVRLSNLPLARHTYAEPITSTILPGMGNALSFDGNNGKNEAVLLLGNGIKFPKNEWTEEAWIYVRPNNDGFRVILGDPANAGANRSPSLYISDFDKLQGAFGDGTNSYAFATANSVLTVSAWNHVAITYDGTAIKLFTNGALAQSFNQPGVSNTFALKSLGPSYGLFPLLGSVDEVRIWNYARTEQEIANNYNTILDAGTPGLMAYYDFNQGVASGDNTNITTLYDSKNTYNGRIVNFALTGSTSNFIGSLNMPAPTANTPTSVTGTSFTASWAVPSGVAVQKYFLEVSYDPTFTDASKILSDYQNKDMGYATSENITNFTSTPVSYRVRALYNVSTHISANSNIQSIYSLAPPSTAGTTNITAGSFVANWVSPPGVTVGNYTIDVASDINFTNILDSYKNLSIPGTSTSVLVNGLSPDAKYYYRIRATAASATSPNSDIGSGQTPASLNLGNALDFDGVDDGLTISNSGIALPNKSWTGELWIKPTLGNREFRNLFGNAALADAVGINRSPSLYIHNNTKLHGVFGDGTAYYYIDAPNVITPDKWNHVAFTYDGSALTIYVNGIARATAATTATSNGWNVTSLAAKALVDENNNFQRNYQGAMDEVRFWNYARTASEIQANYLNTVDKNSNGLLLYYDFDQGVAAGDNTGINKLVDNKGLHEGIIASTFALTGATSNFVGTLNIYPPVAASATLISPTSFTANWAAALGTNPLRYYLEVSADPTFVDAGKYIAGYQNLNVGAVTSYNVAGITAYPVYYRVWADYTNFTHPGEPSKIMSVSSVAAPVATVASNVSTTSLTVNWTIDPGVNPTSYLLDISTSASFTENLKHYNSLPVPGTATSWDISKLSPKGVYYYRLRVIVNGSLSLSSNVMAVSTTTKDYMGNALAFGKFNDVVKIKPVLFPNNQWTEELWVYLGTADQNNGVRLLVGNNQALGDTGAPSLILKNNNLDAGFSDGTAWKSFTIPASQIAYNAWNHFAMSYDGINLNVYLNGVLYGSANLPATSSNQFAVTNIGGGAIPWHSALGSIMDEVRLWNYARSAAEISANFNSPVDPNSNGLLAYYNFNQGIANGDNRAVSTLVDQKNTYEGTFQNFNRTGITSNFVGLLNLPAPVATSPTGIDNTSFTANWIAPASTTTTPQKYFLDVSTDPTFADATKLLSGYNKKDVGSVTNFTLTGLTSLPVYYRVWASYQNPAGLSGVSNVMEYATLESPVMATPTNITFSSIDFNWSGPAQTFSNYQLDVATDAAFNNKLANYNNLLLPSTTTTLSVSGLTPGFTYYYRVRAIAGNINSAYATGTMATLGLPIIGNALLFDGGDDSVTNLGGGAGITLPNNQWTQEALIYPRWGNSGLRGLITGNDASGDGAQRSPSLYVLDNTTLVGGYGAGTTFASYTLNKVLTGNAWNHVAQTFDGTTLKVYVNGVFIQSFNLPGTSNKYTIQNIGVGTNATNFDGYIDEVRIWDHVRTGQEIQADAFKAISPTSNGIVAYYDFDQGKGSGNNKDIPTVLDNNGDKYNGTLNNFALFGGNSNFIGSLNLIAPTALNASNIYTTSFNANWQSATGSDTMTNYFLEVSTDQTFADATKYVSGYSNQDMALATSETITGLTASTQYYYRLKTKYPTSLHSSAHSAVIPVTTSAILAPPTSLSASNIGGTVFTATWAKPASTTVDTYQLDVATDANFTNILPAYNNLTLPGTATTQNIFKLSPATTYYYRVRAVQGSSTSASSGAGTLTTTAAFAGIGNWLSFDGVDDGLSLTEPGITYPSNLWTQEAWVYIPATGNSGLRAVIANNDASATGANRAPGLYILDNTKVSGGYGNGTAYNAYTTADVLTPGTWNHIAQTFDGGNLSVYVGGLLVQKYALPGTSNAYKTQTFGVAGTNATTYLSGYLEEVRIWNYNRSAQQIFDSYKTPIDIAMPGLLSYYDFDQGTAAGNNTTIVSAIDLKDMYDATLNNFAKMGPGSNFIGNLTIMPPIANTATAVGSNSFTANWTPAADTTPGKYFLEVSTDPTFADANKDVANYNGLDVGTATTYAVTDLNAGGVYYYRIKAVLSGLKNPVRSNTVSVNLLLPSPIIAAATSVTSGGFMANWSMPGGENANGYQIDVSTNPAFSSFVIQNVAVAGTATSYLVIPAAANTTYYYRVRAVGSATATSANSASISLVTQTISNVGNALMFNGFDSVIDLDNGGFAFPTNKWTLEALVYDIQERHTRSVFANNQLTTKNWAPYIHTVNTNAIEVGFGDGTNWIRYTTGNVLLGNAWNHVAATFDAVTLRVYANGLLVASYVPSVTASANSNINKITKVGGIPAAVGRFSIYNQLDEVRAWDYARSAQQIFDNYQTTVNPASPGLLLHYDFEQGIGGGDNANINKVLDNKLIDGTLTNFSKTGTAYPNSNFVGPYKYAAPVANPATATGSSFTANWVPASGATPSIVKYLLDVSSDPTFADAAKFVPGYQNVDVGPATNYIVSGMNAQVVYYRVRAMYATSLHPSPYSNVITVTSTLNNANLTLAANDVKQYGDATYKLAVSSSSTGAITYQVTGGDAVSIDASSGSVTVVKTGTATVVVTQAASDTYLSGGPATQTITVIQRVLTAMATAADKIFDGYQNATVTVTVSGTVNNDVITASTNQALFNSPDAGINQAITLGTITLAGSATANYTLGSNKITASATITAIPATVTFVANDKGYDGTNTAAGVFTIVGKASGDLTTATAKTITFADANVGTNKAVTAEGITLSTNNYTLNNTTATAAASISTKEVRVAFTAINKEYDGTNTASGTFVINGLTASESVTANAAQITFADAKVGFGKVVTFNTITFSNPNYVADATSTANNTSTANITRKALTVTAADNVKYVNTNNPAFTATYAGFIPGENENNAFTTPVSINTTATTNTPAGKYAITPTGAVADNYAITYVEGTLTIRTGVINAMTLTTNAMYENQPAGTSAGSVTASSEDPNEIFTYSLVPGTGDTDNSRFTINGGNLVLNEKLDYEKQSTYSVRIRATNSNGGIFEKEYTFNISDLNDAPTLDNIPSQTICASDKTAKTIALTGVTDGDAGTQTLTPTIATDKQNMFKSVTVSIDAATKSGLINYQLADGAEGIALVTVTLQDNGGTAGGGMDTYSTSFTINVGAVSITFTTSTGKPAISRGGTIDITAQTANGVSYTWTDAKGNVVGNNTSKLTVRAVNPVTYYVKAVTAEGCAGTSSINIDVIDDYILVNAYNFMSTNGDGVNDKFVIKNIDMYPKAIVTVYDKAGKVVFKKQTYDNSWEGHFNGVPLKEDTYYYVIDFGDGFYKAKGYVTILNK